MKILMCAIAAWCLWLGGLPQSAQVERQAVELVKRTPASMLEEELPGIPFAAWLREVVGAQAGIVWQLSECDLVGAPTEPGADMTACVEANALLPDGRKVVILVNVGTIKKGITGVPGFYYAVIEQHEQLYSLRRLLDLREVLRAPETLQERLRFKLIYPEAQLTKAPLDLTERALPDASNLSEMEISPPDLASEATPKAAPKRAVGPLSEKVLLSNTVKRVGPIYPANAKSVNASGEVQVLIVISETGHVIEARAISGHLLLRNAAITAARQWVFTPAKLNGATVPVEGVLTFVFERP